MMNKTILKKSFHIILILLWPLNRSLTGNDTRKTHKILSQIVKLKTTEVKSGTRVNDWTIPLEWNVKDAYITNLKMKKL